MWNKSSVGDKCVPTSIIEQSVAPLYFAITPAGFEPVAFAPAIELFPNAVNKVDNLLIIFWLEDFKACENGSAGRVVNCVWSFVGVQN